MLNIYQQIHKCVHTGSHEFSNIIFYADPPKSYFRILIHFCAPPVDGVARAMCPPHDFIFDFLDVGDIKHVPVIQCVVGDTKSGLLFILLNISISVGSSVFWLSLILWINFGWTSTTPYCWPTIGLHPNPRSLQLTSSGL